MFRNKFWLSLALTIPVIFWSTDVQHWLGYRAPSFPGSKFIPAILGTAVFVYGGLLFIRGAWGELAARKPGMMTLISLAIVVAFGTSLAATFGLFEIDVWWEVASLITIMLLGHWLEMRAISQARGALDALAALLPDTAERVTEDETQTVPLSALQAPSSTKSFAVANPMPVVPPVMTATFPRNFPILTTPSRSLSALISHQAFIPPSTVRFVPVMYEDSGPATNATIAAISSTDP
jgi:hypothetical protein